jgi:hypothetical protein
MSIKNSSDIIGNRSLDLPVCSAVPQPLCHCVPFLVVVQQENNEFILQKNILRQFRKRISSRPLNPKPDGLLRMLFLIFQKDERERFAGI